jgi:hypothetical protein
MPGPASGRPGYKKWWTLGFLPSSTFFGSSISQKDGTHNSHVPSGITYPFQGSLAHQLIPGSFVNPAEQFPNLSCLGYWEREEQLTQTCGQIQALLLLTGVAWS